MRTGLKVLTLVAAGFLLGTVARAQFVVPQSYTAPTGEVGGLGASFPYIDETGTQLIDGLLGSDDWTAGNAYQWLGWLSVNPTVTFTFTGNPAIRTVYIGLNRGEATGGIYLPPAISIGGTNFTLTGSEFVDATRGDLAFSGLWTGNSLVINFTNYAAGSAWVFVDEIRFSTAAIPEPTATSLTFGLLGLVGLAVGWFRRCRASAA